MLGPKDDIVFRLAEDCTGHDNDAKLFRVNQTTTANVDIQVRLKENFMLTDDTSIASHIQRPVEPRKHKTARTMISMGDFPGRIISTQCPLYVFEDCLASIRHEIVDCEKMVAILQHS